MSAGLAEVLPCSPRCYSATRGHHSDACIEFDCGETEAALAAVGKALGVRDV